MPEPLPAELASAIRSSADRLGPFSRVEYHAEVGSTNDIALARAAAGAPHGTVIVAGMQRAGRGRQGRDWFSPAGEKHVLHIRQCARKSIDVLAPVRQIRFRGGRDGVQNLSRGSCISPGQLFAQPVKGGE